MVSRGESISTPKRRLTAIGPLATDGPCRSDGPGQASCVLGRCVLGRAFKPRLVPNKSDSPDNSDSAPDQFLHFSNRSFETDKHSTSDDAVSNVQLTGSLNLSHRNNISVGQAVPHVEKQTSVAS